MNWKVGCALIPVLMLLWAGVSDSDPVPRRLTDLSEGYRRPAEIPFPADNRYYPAKAQLGRTLFFDPILSGSRARSCASCHNPGLSWGDGLPLALGEDQKALALRAPTLLAVAWMPRLGWDGKFRDIESVAFGPITSTANMNLPEAALIERLSGIAGYVSAFAATFGE